MLIPAICSAITLSALASLSVLACEASWASVPLVAAASESSPACLAASCSSGCSSHCFALEVSGSGGRGHAAFGRGGGRGHGAFMYLMCLAGKRCINTLFCGTAPGTSN